MSGCGCERSRTYFCLDYFWRVESGFAFLFFDIFVFRSIRYFFLVWLVFVLRKVVFKRGCCFNFKEI